MYESGTYLSTFKQDAATVGSLFKSGTGQIIFIDPLKMAFHHLSVTGYRSSHIVWKFESFPVALEILNIFSYILIAARQVNLY